MQRKEPSMRDCKTFFSKVLQLNSRDKIFLNSSLYKNLKKFGILCITRFWNTVNKNFFW